MRRRFNVLTRTLKHWRTGTFGLGGGGDLIARKKLQNARKHVLYKRTQIAVKTKTLPILTSNVLSFQNYS